MDWVRGKIVQEGETVMPLVEQALATLYSWVLPFLAACGIAWVWLSYSIGRHERGSPNHTDSDSPTKHDVEPQIDIVFGER